MKIFNQAIMTRIPLFIAIFFILAACSPSEPPSESTAEPVAQTNLTCDQLVETALTTVDETCEGLGRNQACYGSDQVIAELQANTDAKFDAVGDIINLPLLKQITTSALDEAQQTWGVALIKAQANLPDSLPGQNVTLLVYGGAVLDNVTPDMQAVILNTGVGGITCADAPTAAVVVQSPDGTQVNLKVNGASVTLGSTLYMTAVQNDSLTIATIEGEGIVESAGITRVVSPGSQVSLPMTADNGLTVSGPPSEPEPFDVAPIQSAPLTLLERPVQVPPPITVPTNTPALPVTSTLPPVTIAIPPTATSTPCAPRADWTDSYTIQDGDTLFSIAQSYGLSLAQLQTGNCITDANQIFAGQTLRVPFVAPTATPILETPTRAQITASPTSALPPGSPTPVDANFRADETTLTAGECTILRWEAQNAQSVFFDGQPTTVNGTTEVCPTATRRYTLLVIQADGTQTPYFVSITVQ
jgi:LysM repeat protein